MDEGINFRLMVTKLENIIKIEISVPRGKQY